jgi:hypothetical protein
MKLDEVAVERPLLVHLVVLLDEGLREVPHLEAGDLQALLLEAAEDFADESALDAVGLQEDEGSFEHGEGRWLPDGGGKDP